MKRESAPPLAALLIDARRGALQAHPRTSPAVQPLAIVKKLSRSFTALAKLIGSRIRELESGTAPKPFNKLVHAKDWEAVRAAVPGTLLTEAEGVVFAAALATHLQPHLFDEAIAGALTKAADYPRIGGVRGKDSRLFLPTGETVMFLLGAVEVDQRLEALSLFDEEHPFARKGILRLEKPAANESWASGRLELGEDVVDQIMGLPTRRPRLGPDFPAQRLSTKLDWEDLVLEKQTAAEVREIESWIRHGETLLVDWELERFIRPGYRALFYGPSGTGKTLTASLLGKQTGRDVYRIDLSLVVSKYIGETEKNLSRIFAKAEDKNWILFFDEADALFGKRTGVKDSHDRYANQETSYLLQRVETFGGLVILASNLRTNIDEAFLRRFQSVIHFPKPNAEERQRIWNRIMPRQARLSERVNLTQLCQRHELTGANIANVLQYASLQSLERGDRVLDAKDIELAIAREYEKEGRLG